MKKFLAMIVAVVMLFSIATFPTMAEPTAVQLQRTSDDISIDVEAVYDGKNSPAEAATLDEALNVEGGALTFTTSEEYPWEVVEDYAGTTNIGVDDSVSSLYTTVEMQAGDELFYDVVVCAERYDRLLFVVNGEQENYFDGDERWTVPYWSTDSFMALEDGVYAFEWHFEKDVSEGWGDDRAYIDNVRLERNIPVTGVGIQAELNIFEGFIGRMSWEILPSNASVQGVTFESSDTSVATVNADGVVTGVSAGEAVITVTTDYGAFTDTCTVTVSEDPTPVNPEVTMYGMSLYEPNTTGNWVRFTSANPSVLEIVTPDLDAASATYVDGYVYAYGPFDHDAGVHEFYRFPIDDPTAIETIGDSSNDLSQAPIIQYLAYDYSTGKLYGGGSNTAGRCIVEIDIETGNILSIKNLGGEAIAMGFTGGFTITTDGTAYGILDGTFAQNSGNPGLYRINLQSGEATRVGNVAVNCTYLQSMAYDHDNGILYWAQYYSYNQCHLYEVDPATGAVKQIGRIGQGAEIGGLFVVNEVDIPDPVFEDITVEFIDGVNGNVISTYDMVECDIIPESAFPEAPHHNGYTFIRWSHEPNTMVPRGVTAITANYMETPEDGYATVILSVPANMWTMMSGYQMLLDADADTFGVIIPDAGPLYYGDVPEEYMAEFDYTIPENADGIVSGFDDVVLGATVAITIPAGIYDWCVTNPATDLFGGQTTWIASDNGNIPGRYDNYEFRSRHIYEFTLSRYWETMEDQVNLLIFYPPASTVVLGDANLDGVVETADALLILCHALEVVLLTDPEALDNSDVDGDGDIDSADAVLALRIALDI